MARHSTTVRITDEGRDQGKVFLVTEMFTAPAERWVIRAMFALASSGVNLPPDFMELGFAGFIRMGFGMMSHIRYDLVEPLYEELIANVVAIPDPSKPNITRALVEDDTEEIFTRMELRKAAWDINAQSFIRAVRSKLAGLQKAGG